MSAGSTKNASVTGYYVRVRYIEEFSLEELEKRLAKVENLLKEKAVIARLPDKGQKLYDSLATIQAELDRRAAGLSPPVRTEDDTPSDSPTEHSSANSSNPILTPPSTQQSAPTPSTLASEVSHLSDGIAQMSLTDSKLESITTTPIDSSSTIITSSPSSSIPTSSSSSTTSSSSSSSSSSPTSLSNPTSSTSITQIPSPSSSSSSSSSSLSHEPSKPILSTLTPDHPSWNDPEYHSKLKKNSIGESLMKQGSRDTKIKIIPIE